MNARMNLSAQNTEKSQDSFNAKEITYLSDHKKSINFTFLQSMALIAAYATGSNKESLDCKLFDKDKSKMRVNKQKEVTNTKQKAILTGKTKKFGIDRYFAILDFLLSITAMDSYEVKNYGHTLDYLATINSLAEEGLLKKSITKNSDSTLDDLCSIAFKCNFDQNFILEVAQKVNFPLTDYLLQEVKEE